MHKHVQGESCWRIPRFHSDRQCGTGITRLSGRIGVRNQTEQPNSRRSRPDCCDEDCCASGSNADWFRVHFLSWRMLMRHSAGSDCGQCGIPSDTNSKIADALTRCRRFPQTLTKSGDEGIPSARMPPPAGLLRPPEDGGGTAPSRDRRPEPADDTHRPRRAEQTDDPRVH